MFCLYVYFCNAGYVGCFSIDFQIPVLKCRKNLYFFVYILFHIRIVMATLAKRKRTKASIIVFSSISKRSEHVRKLENLFRSEANMFMLKNLKIEAKRRYLILNCKSSEAKRTYLLPKIKLARRSELVYFKTLPISKRSEQVR